MSFVIAFHRFMAVRVRDDGGEPVDALDFAPTAPTLRRLADHAMLCRTERDGFSLYYSTNPAVTPALNAPVAERVRFSFAIRVRNPGFLERVHPDFDAGGAHILLDNLAGGGAIQTSGPLSSGATVETADLTAIGPDMYPVRLDVSGGAPDTVAARDRFSSAVVAETGIRAEPGAAEVIATLDLGGSAEAALELFAPAPASLSRAIYADAELAKSGATGVVDLHWDQPQDAVPAGTGAEYEVVFRRR